MKKFSLLAFLINAALVEAHLSDVWAHLGWKRVYLWGEMTLGEAKAASASGIAVASSIHRPQEDSSFATITSDSQFIRLANLLSQKDRKSDSILVVRSRNSPLPEFEVVFNELKGICYFTYIFCCYLKFFIRGEVVLLGLDRQSESRGVGSRCHRKTRTSTRL